MLDVEDVDEYIDVMTTVDADSGVDGSPHSHPYSSAEPVDLAAAREREITRWTTGIDELGWRRAWGLVDGRSIVGHIHLAGGALRSEAHRVSMGMGILSSHRRRGGGSLLLDAAIDWATRQPGIAWIDLGVFTDNPGAQALYASHGFQVLGRMPDRFRVDGATLDDISMTLDVS